MDREEKLRAEIIEVGRRLYERKLLVAKDGNLSVRIGDFLLITASGFCKGTLTPAQISKVDMNGRIISGKKPAADIKMHLAVYRTRRETGAIVHAHPPVATGFAIAGLELTKVTLPEVLFHLGSVGMTAYATPTTEEVPAVVIEKLAELPDCQALILANHGALTFGPDITEAFYKMETLEMYLTATLVARLLGRENELTETQMQKIDDIINLEGVVDRVVSKVMERFKNRENS